MNKIIINGRFLTQMITGVQRYAIELVKALDHLIEIGEIDKNIYQFELVSPNNTINDLKLKNISLKKIGILSGHMWEQTELPLYVRRRLLINLCNAGPIIKRRQIVTIHDASVYANLSNFSFTFGTWYRFLLKRLATRSYKVITDSEFSRTEIVKYTKALARHIRVIYLGKEHLLSINRDEIVLSKNGLKKNSFILAVSSLNPNKNFQSIVVAVGLLNGLNIDIVIAGTKNSKVFGNLNKVLPANVKQVGHVTDNELKSLYENALCFIYPSYYEGFGLPPLEAMVCGSPVIISNAASLPEVFGDAALYCDPYNPVDIANKIKVLTNDEKLRDTLREKGFERAKQFTWEKCALETMEVIEEVLSQ